MPDKLPKGWSETTLGEVCLDSQYGWTSKASKTGQLKYVRTTDITGGTIDWESVPFCRDVPPDPEKYLLADGDILISRAGSVGFSHRVTSPLRAVFASYLIRFRPEKQINGLFLAHYLQSPAYWSQVRSKASGVAVQNLNASKLGKFSLPLPPTREQDRIVGKLDAALSRLAAGEVAARRAQERLKRYRAAVLHAAVTGELTFEWRKTNKATEAGVQLFRRVLKERRVRWEEAELNRLRATGKPPRDTKWKRKYKEPISPGLESPRKLPFGWRWISLGQVVWSVKDGPHYSPKYVPKGVPFITGGNVRPSGVDFVSAKRISRALYVELSKRCKPEIGDVLYTKGGTTGIARVNTYTHDFSVWVHVAVLKLVDSVNPFFLQHSLNSPDCYAQAQQFTHGVSNQDLGLTRMVKISMALPPLKEQEAIVSEVERRVLAADRLEVTLNKQIERAQATRHSLFLEAFAGHLVPQDPKDEPASFLLDRIRTERAQEEARRKNQKNIRSVSYRTKKQKKVAMKQTAPTSESLRTVWKKIGKKTDARVLFDATGFASEQVVEFYELLRATTEIRGAFEAVSRPKSRMQRASREILSDEKTPKGRFRLVTLWLEDFKNLKNYEVRFGSAHGLDVILGWNGTGKSNLFEALVIIFRDLHSWSEKNRWPEEPMAGYRLVYEIEEQLIAITWDPALMKRPELKRSTISVREDDHFEFEVLKRQQLRLPRFIFGYYSGPTNRLAEHFLPMKRDHYDRLVKARSDDPETLARLLQKRRFFCAETHHAKYVLLAFSYKEDPKITQFLEHRLRILGFESALFVIRRPGWARKGSTPEDFWGATGIMLRVMEKLRRFAIAPMVIKQTVSDGYRSTTEDHYFFFLPDLKCLHQFAAEYPDARSFFLALESTDFSELIHDVKIQVRVKAADHKQIPITFRELSEGEQQLLMVLGLMRFTKSHQSLVLLDEPDTHLNPHWSVDYLKDLASVISDDDKPSPEQQTSQLLMATHDPLVIASLLKDQVHLLKRERDSLQCFWQQASENPRGLGFTGILISDMFGFRSDLDEETLALLDRQVQLAAKANKLSPAEKNELAVLNKEIDALGFKRISSDPYYHAFIDGLSRRQEALALIQKPVQTSGERILIEEAADEILAKLAEKHSLRA